MLFHPLYGSNSCILNTLVQVFASDDAYLKYTHVGRLLANSDRLHFANILSLFFFFFLSYVASKIISNFFGEV